MLIECGSGEIMARRALRSAGREEEVNDVKRRWPWARKTIGFVWVGRVGWGEEGGRIGRMR